MTEFLIQHLGTIFEHAYLWGPLLIFIFMTVESSFVPFPSEVVMIPAGFLAAHNHARGGLLFGDPYADATLAVVLGTSGSLLGAYINYYLAKWLGQPFLEQYGRYFFLPPDKLHRAEEVFREYGAGTTFICRLIPGIRQLISIPAGIAGMRLAPFTMYTGLGAGIWVTFLTGLGFYWGLRTEGMTPADLVHGGKALVKSNLHWIFLGSAAFFVTYVWAHKRIMKVKAPRPA